MRIEIRPQRLPCQPRSRSLWRTAILVALTASFAATANAQTITVPPGRSYLRASGETPPGALALVLQTLGFQPRDGMRLERLGTFKPGAPFADASSGMIAVFSGSDVLLGVDQPHRVPGAIDAGMDIVTARTYYNGLTTDIPEDFAVVDTALQVPDGATHLFIAASDSLYRDNTDPDGNFAVRITHAILPVQASHALRIWAGLLEATAEDAAIYNIITGAGSPGIDIVDACRLARLAAGTDS